MVRSAPSSRAKSRGDQKMEMTMHEYKNKDLHSGSKHGPLVKSRKQAIAIGLSQKRKADSGDD